MTTTALRTLIKAVEAGTATTMQFEDAGIGVWGELAYVGSLDAAKVRHEDLMPGWGWHVSHAGASVWYPGVEGDSIQIDADNAQNPARAWLLCILRAKLTEGENDD